jgi:hypothetical protein
MKKNYVIIFVLFLFVGVVTQAYGQLKLSGELRPRPEYQHGYHKLRNEGDKAVDFISQRTRVNFNYKGESLVFKVVLQDVRNWGDTPQINSSDSFLSLHEAWGEVMFNDEFSLKIGRQELVYDDHRILGNVGWAQQARSHDVGVFKYEGDFKVHFGLAFNLAKDSTFINYQKYYRALQFAWFNKEFSNLDVSILFLNNGLQGLDDVTGLLTDDTRYSQTIGTYMKGNLSVVSLDGSFYYQMGKDRENKSLSAYNVALHASFNVIDAVKLKAGIEMLSGTDDLETNNNNSFNPFYGTNHKFNGFMDYFYAGSQHIDNVGLNDFTLGGEWKLDKWSTAVTAHYFMSNANLHDKVTSEVLSSSLGTEIDLTLGYKFNHWINFSAGYSQMFATSSMEVLKGGSKDVTNNWAYLMITLKPTFLDTSK